MTAVYPTIKVYFDTNNDGLATGDQTAAVVSSIELRHGIFDYSEVNRLASIGTLRFDLTNDDGFYTGQIQDYIGHAVRITVALGRFEKQVWFGRITDITVDPADWGPRRLHVTATDWMNNAQNTRVPQIDALTNAQLNEAMAEISSVAPVPPAYSKYDEGFEEFVVVFDTSQPKTVVYSEIDKVVKSELGYAYLRFRDRSNGETLIAENYIHRGSTVPLTTYPHAVTTAYHIKWSNATASGLVKYANATYSGNLFLSPELSAAEFDRTMIDSEWETGRYVVNQASVSHIPRTYDTSNAVLYSLGSPLVLGAGYTITIKGGYSNPNGGAKINAASTVTPVATTDYLANSEKDGSGSNLTANLAITYTSGASGFTATIKNNGPYAYLTFFRVRGIGIYRDNPFEIFKEDDESQTEFVGVELQESIVREYSEELNVSSSFAEHMLAVNRYPRNVMKSVTFLANYSEDLMLAFMYLEQGDKVKIIESQPSHTGYYYIQGVHATIQPSSGLIYFTWYLKEADETICQPIAIDGNLETFTPPALPTRHNAIDFGILPQFSNMPAFSFSVWLKRLSSATFGILIGRSAYSGSSFQGAVFAVDTGGELYFKSNKVTTDGEWETTSSVVGQNAWTHCVVTYDNVTTGAVPKFYVDGTEITSITTIQSPVGASADDSDCPVIVFAQGRNPTTPGEVYHSTNANIRLKDVRIYDRILTQADITILAAGEDDYTTVTSGLKFQGFWVPVDNITDYINAVIVTGEDRVIDVVNAAGGVPWNENETNNNYMMYGYDITA